MADVKPVPSCASCGRSLPVNEGRGRPREYCNATCRSAARRRRDRADEAVPLSVNPFLTESGRRGSLGAMPDPASGPQPPPGGRPETEPEADGRLLEAIATARRSAAEADAALQRAVGRARESGHSWREIGVVLETTRQAAFQRFGRPLDPRTGAPLNRTVAPGAAEKAVAIFADMAACRWEAVCRTFGESMRAQLDADRLAAGWLQTIGGIGSFERMGEAFARTLGDKTVVNIPLYFEAGERTGRVSLDGAGEVVGLFIRPAPAEETRVPPIEREPGRS